MESQIQKINIDCNHCVLDSSNESSSFTVKVPVSDNRCGLDGIGILRCTLSANKHYIDLVKLVDNLGNQIKINKKCVKRLQKTLGFISNKKLCGNQNLCPEKVIKLVNTLLSNRED